MVRVDHEDGGVLNPDDNPDKPEPEKTPPEKAERVVVKSSPLRRKPKRAARRDGTPDPLAVGDEVTAGESAETDEVLVAGGEEHDSGDSGTGGSEAVAVEAEALEPPGGEVAATGPAPADPSASDTSASSVSYRDRRQGAQRRRTAAEAAAASRRAPRTGVWRVAAVALGAVLLIAGLVGSVVFAVGLQRAAHERDLRAEYTAFARQVVVQMTTLDAENADAMYELALKQTSGRAQQVFKENMKTVSAMIREADAVTKSTVITEAVSEANDTEGTVLMVIGWESRDKAGKQEPLYQTFRFRVGMTRINDELKATDLEFVW